MDGNTFDDVALVTAYPAGILKVSNPKIHWNDLGHGNIPVTSVGGTWRGYHIW